MQEQQLPPPPFGEASFDRNDNWLPQSGRLLARVGADQWRELVRRYLKSTVEAFAQELAKVCAPALIPCERTRERYNVKSVETYWEWLSDDPLKVVHELWGPLRSFSQRRRTLRTYDVECTSEDDHDLHVIHVEYSPGEVLKCYAKTNQRIRIEVSHNLVGDESFRFPREKGDDGTITRRRGGHVFETQTGVLTFLERLRERAAVVVNRALEHIGKRTHIPSSHITAYRLLAAIAHAVPDFTTGITVISKLVNTDSLSAGGIDDASALAIGELRARGIIESTGKGKPYVVTAPYRRALRSLQLHGSWPILVGRIPPRQ